MKDTLENDAIDETAAVIATAIRKHVERAQQRADTELKAIAAQHREALSDKKKLAAALDASRAELDALQTQLQRAEQKTAQLAAERADLQRRLEDAVAASRQLTEGLSRTLNQQQAARPAPKSASSSSPAPPSPPSAKKKPLQFPGPARDAKRVKIRQGTYVSVDGIPGELVDLSLGGAQAVLTQMVKPNQLVRLTIPTAGERIICRARIVWVVYEQPGTSLSVYRTGVKFTDIDTKAVEDFMCDFSEQSLGKRSPEIA